VNPADQKDYYPALLRAVRAIPGVQAAGAADFVPLLGSSVSMAGRLDTGKFESFGGRMILPGYFEALGVPLRHGRHVDDSDVAASRPVALINEAAEQELFSGASAIGRRVEMSKVEYEIVGVVASFRHMGPSADQVPELYRLFRAGTEKFRQAQGLTVVVRAAGSTPGLSDALRQAAASIGPRAVIGRVASGDEWFGETVVTPRQRTVMLGLLGTLGLLLTVVGVIGMTAYAVAHRTREIGVRMAFGARPGQVVGRIVRESVVPAAIGLAVGLGGALYATRLIRSFLFETASNDPATFIAAGVTILTTASIAAWLPARRAARIDPVSALRSE
jgi:putative ABC transport system permease protein